LALIGAAQLAVADGMATGDEAIGIGERVYCGRALVATDPGEAFGALEPGDVVVTSATSPSWNALLVEAGALVTTEGGAVSHAALIARELGLPAVVGHRGGTTIRTGDQVEVDPRRATVRVLTVAAGSPTS
jgi:pyruvate,water dikinase